uniref:Uncharacterized protein n=1 Tax=Anopheles arabiensis TaxID=7173 RepID=A0A182IGC1_ANOAR
WSLLLLITEENIEYQRKCQAVTFDRRYCSTNDEDRANRKPANLQWWKSHKREIWESTFSFLVITAELEAVEFF